MIVKQVNSWRRVPHFEYFDLFPQQRLGFGQILLVDAFYCHLPVVFLQGNITGEIISTECVVLFCSSVFKSRMYSVFSCIFNMPLHSLFTTSQILAHVLYFVIQRDSPHQNNSINHGPATQLKNYFLG